MDERAERTKPLGAQPAPDMEQLLRMLEAQRTAGKGKAGAAAGFRHPMVRYGALAGIVVFALGSVGLMEMFLSQIQRPVRTGAISPALPGTAMQTGTSSAASQQKPSTSN